MKHWILALAVVVGLFVTDALAAEELTGTLKKVKDSGEITLGVRESSIPFSYLDDKQNYIGYSIDLCDRIAAAVRRKLGLDQLSVKYQPVSSATRIPLMANGTIDLECGSTTNNEERQKQVAFAPTTFVTANRILYKKSSGIKVLADLKGKTLVSTAGTSNIKQVTILNADRNLNMTILSAKDHPEAFLMVETDRAAAFAMDDVLLASLAATSKTPEAFEVSSEALSVEPYGIMLRRDDPAFKAVVDKAITDLFQSGDINTIYNKWFLSPIPPRGINLHVPMSDQLKAVIAKPTDSGDPAAYAAVPQAQQDTLKHSRKTK
jgi:glutamate/aspartate transport system substrate-binding protein